MSDYDLFGDYEPERPATLEEEVSHQVRRERRRRGGGVYNFISFLFLAATVGAIVVTVLLIQNPTAPYNPFPPPTPQPTPTLFLVPGVGENQFPPVQTPSPAPTEGATPTPHATSTQTPTSQPTPTGISQPPGATHTLARYPFTVQDGAVTYTQNPNDRGCDWLGIAGQVLGLDGGAVPGLPISVKGEDFEWIAFSGSATQWGESGFEVELDSTPREAEFEVQLLNTTGLALSEVVIVRTLASCDHNVAIINFVQNHEFAH